MYHTLYKHNFIQERCWFLAWHHAMDITSHVVVVVMGGVSENNIHMLLKVNHFYMAIWHHNLLTPQSTSCWTIFTFLLRCSLKIFVQVSAFTHIMLKHFKIFDNNQDSLIDELCMCVYIYHMWTTACGCDFLSLEHTTNTSFQLLFPSYKNNNGIIKQSHQCYCKTSFGLRQQIPPRPSSK